MEDKEIRVHTDKNGKDHIDVYSNDQKEEHTSIDSGDMIKNNMIIYISRDGNIKVDVNIQNEDIWMSEDVEKDSVVKKFLITAEEYYLEMLNREVEKIDN